MAVIIRAALIYLFVLLLLRITTRRIIRSATAADMVIVFVFGGFAIQAVMGDERSVTAACLALVTVTFVRFGLQQAMTAWPVIGMLTEGTASVVFANGEWNDARLRELRVERRDVLAEMRQKGLRRFDQVETVVMEHNGGISVIEKVDTSG
jgi:uncharacterized membrane protein YcaP (DUF421 family)